MFEQRVHRTKTSSAFGMLAVIYHSTVRQIRKGHSAGGLGLITNIFQTVALIFIFWALFEVTGMRKPPIRADFLVFLMSGVFLFLTHVKSIGAVFGTPSPTSPLTQHAPLNTIVEIVSSALAMLYLQFVTVVVVLFIYHAAITPVTIDRPLGALAMFLLAWFAGCAFGMVFLAAKPWAPRPVMMVKMVFQRMNLIASGKFFVANSVPAFILPFFIWNPLFHIIDQARGFVFLNYTPRATSIEYPLFVALALIMVGLMGEFFTRQHASISWNARR